MIAGNIKPELEIQLRDYCKNQKCTISKATNNAIEDFLKTNTPHETNLIKKESEIDENSNNKPIDLDSYTLADLTNELKKEA